MIMKTCTYCGAQLDDHAAACYNCGSPCQDAVPQSAYTPVQGYQVPYGTPPKNPITIGGWIGRSLIPCIPLVGGLVYLIMLFVWSGDATKEDTFRNWAKAQLVLMGIAIGIVVLLVILFAILGLSMADMY